MTNDLFDSLMAGIKSLPSTATLVREGGVLLSDEQPITMVPLALPMYDFQEEAVQHALRDTVNKPYGYIGLDMGLGKTPCGIAVAAACAAVGIKPTLIVVPPALRVNWHRELVKFAPWLRSATIRSTKPDVGDVIPDVDVLILGDSSLTGWADFFTGKVGALIVDEAHRFKNASKRAAALAQIASGVKKIKDVITKKWNRTVITTVLPRVRVLMSGTPTPNGRHAELATQVDIMGDGAWRDIGGKGIFWNHYAPAVDKYGTRISQDGASLFKAMSSTWFFRRLRGDVLDLPAKGRTALHLEGQGRAVTEYKSAEADLIAWLAGKNNGKVTDGQRRAKALIMMLALRQLAGAAKVRSVIEHAKGLLDEQPGGVFIVAEHKDVIDDLLLGLSKYNPTTVRGGQNDADRQMEVDDFCSGKSRVLIGQITSAGVGLTLHGGGINHHVLIAQLPWTPAELKQAEDRLHRIGQTHDVTVEVSLCAIDGIWSIDERLWGMLESKNFNSTTITDGEGEYLLNEIQDGLLDSYRS